MLIYAIIIILFCIILIISFVGIGSSNHNGVSIMHVSHLDIIEKLNLEGRVHPIAEVEVSSEVSGEIRKIFVREGDYVKKEIN